MAIVGAVGTADQHVAHAGDDHAVDVGDQHLPAGRARPHRNHALELALQPALRAGAVILAALDPVEPVRKKVGAGLDLPDQLGDRLAAMVEHLNDGADADRHQKCDDECRDRAPQRRLRSQ